jgi:hypothetical protein
MINQMSFPTVVASSMIGLFRVLAFGVGMFAFLSPAVLHAQFKFSPEDSARMAKKAIFEADSIKKAEEAQKLAPPQKPAADSLSVRKPPASTAKTVSRQTAPYAKKNMSRVKDSTATRR